MHVISVNLTDCTSWPFTRLPLHNFKQQQAIVVKGKGDAIIAPLMFG